MAIGKKTIGLRDIFFRKDKKCGKVAYIIPEPHEKMKRPSKYYVKISKVTPGSIFFNPLGKHRTLGTERLKKNAIKKAKNYLKKC